MGEAKYVLVDFFQRYEVEIVDTKDVQAECGGMDGTTQVQVISFSDGPTGKKHISEEIYRKSITLKVYIC